MVIMALARNSFPVPRLAGALALSAALHAALIYGIAGDRRNMDVGAGKRSVIDVSISENSAAATDATLPFPSPVLKAGQALATSPPAISRPLREKGEQASPPVSADGKNTGEVIVAATNSTSAATTAAVTVTAITTFAKALTPVRPDYPATAREGNITGRVTAKLLINETGVVVDSAVVNAEPAGHFEASALEAVRSTRFSPATRNGVAVRSEKQIVVTYRLE